MSPKLPSLQTAHSASLLWLDSSCKAPTVSFFMNFKVTRYRSCASDRSELKPSCSHGLIYRINSLMPEECGNCQETFIVKPTDPHLLSCSICGQEVHHKCYKSFFDGVFYLSSKNPFLKNIVQNSVTMQNPHALGIFNKNVANTKTTVHQRKFEKKQPFLPFLL